LPKLLPKAIIKDGKKALLLYFKGKGGSVRKITNELKKERKETFFM